MTTDFQLPSRRDLLKLAGMTVAGSMVPLPAAASLNAARVVVVGGGFGGSTCARYLRRLAPQVSVTLVEQSQRIVTCPFSNNVLAGFGDLAAVTHNFDGLRRDGIKVVQARAQEIDADRRTVRLDDGVALPFDRLVLSPGIAIKSNSLSGYDAAAEQSMPHAWKAGPQTLLLRRQLESMDDGGVVVITAPASPYRCPPAPYERASLIANYLSRFKPRSKVLILDQKDSFSKAGLFREGWNRLYPGMIEWVGFSMGGNVVAVDAPRMLVITDFEEVAADVANVVPPQRCGNLAWNSGLANSAGWCEVNPRTFESVVAPFVHIVGDSVLAGAMPKSGFSASSQAKVCARAIVGLLRDEEPPDPVLINTCYSLLSREYAISVAAVYRVDDTNEIAQVPESGGVSPANASDDFRKLEAEYARGWYASITSDMYG
ncbi:MAG: NAD(P)/FAD-dependent oxidoreductase [Rhodobacteraceae bacterium]|nr:NAD(P)/FAD-dependent oxidoreductase [Paracoccaceae bacterium]